MTHYAPGFATFVLMLVSVAILTLRPMWWIGATVGSALLLGAACLVVKLKR